MIQVIKEVKFRDKLSQTEGKVINTNIVYDIEYARDAHGNKLAQYDTVMLEGEFVPTNIGLINIAPLYATKSLNELKIQKVIFNNPATVVFWNDGTKTVVKADEEEFDKEKGLAMAIAKKALGNKGNYYNELKKYIGEQE